MASPNEWAFTSPQCQVTNLFAPDDKHDIVYISCDFFGGNVTFVAPRAYEKQLSEGDMIQVEGFMVYTTKKGVTKCKFTAHEIKKVSAGSGRRAAESA